MHPTTPRCFSTVIIFDWWTSWSTFESIIIIHYTHMTSCLWHVMKSLQYFAFLFISYCKDSFLITSSFVSTTSWIIHWAVLLRTFSNGSISNLSFAEGLQLNILLYEGGYNMFGEKMPERKHNWPFYTSFIKLVSLINAHSLGNIGLP